MRIPVATNPVLCLALLSEVLDIETLAQLSFEGFVETQEYGNVLLSDSEKSQNFPGPKDFILYNISEKLLQIQNDVLCFLIENLHYVYIPLLAASTDILLRGHLLHQRGDLVEDFLVNFGVEIA